MSLRSGSKQLDSDGTDFRMRLRSMKYKLNLSPRLDVSAPSITGAQVPPAVPQFFAWQPSTWPATPSAVDEKFVYGLKRIFEDSILGEIANVISDAEKATGDLQHRGHVVGIALLCALDAISSYGYGAKNGKQIPAFVRAHFPAEYHPHARSLLLLYRHAMVHSWNLFEASISPGHEKITKTNGGISFGLLTFFEGLTQATENFLERLAIDPVLQGNVLKRYRWLKKSARP
jgi:hypothetical protein